MTVVPETANLDWYFTEHPYGCVLAFATPFPDMATVNASDT